MNCMEGVVRALRLGRGWNGVAGQACRMSSIRFEASDADVEDIIEKNLVSNSMGAWM